MEIKAPFLSSAILPSDIPKIKTTQSNISSPSNITEKKTAFDEKQAQKVATEFETLFLDMMMKSMRQTAKPEQASNAMDIYQGLLDNEYSKQTAQSQSVGIRDLIVQWMRENA